MTDFPGGGPAFPQHAATGNLESWRHGLALRDYFAAKAMQALITRYGNEDTVVCAGYAYAFADDMLKAREGK